MIDENRIESDKHVQRTLYVPIFIMMKVIRVIILRWESPGEKDHARCEFLRLGEIKTVT